MRIILALSSVVLLCCLLTGCTDRFVGSWQPVELTVMGQTMETNDQEKSEGSMTITKSGSTYTFTAKDGKSMTGQKKADTVVFTEAGTDLKYEVATDPTSSSHIKMRLKSDEMGQATQGLSSTVITVRYERVRAK